MLSFMCRYCLKCLTLWAVPFKQNDDLQSTISAYFQDGVTLCVSGAHPEAVVVDVGTAGCKDEDRTGTFRSMESYRLLNSQWWVNFLL